MQEYDPGPIFEEPQNDGDDNVDMMEVDNLDDDQKPSDSERLLISVDFGTTFSCVAYTRVHKGVRPGEVNISQVNCVNTFDDYEPRGEMAQKREDVPSELWYNPDLDDQDDVEHDPIDVENYPSGKEDHWKSSYASSDEDEPEKPKEVLSRQRTLESQPMTSCPGCWGFQVQNRLKDVDIPKQEQGRLSRFKLLLDNSEVTKEYRHRLQYTLRTLKRKGLIEDKNDIYAHYLTHLLQNAKRHLERSRELEDNPSIEFILCVPAKWPIKGSRILQQAMERAVLGAGFGLEAQESVHNLFIVTEPEAAATCVLAENRNDIYFNEVVLILDAGGGTVDAVTYRVTNNEPLRMDAEVVPPEGKLCGASFINERYEKRLMEKIRDETYLIKNGKTLKSIVKAESINFENGQKRLIDLDEIRSGPYVVYIDDLREDKTKGLKQNRLILTHEDMANKIFLDSLRGTRDILNNQLELAEGPERKVQKVILTGGFGQSPALRNYLRGKLEKYNRRKQATIELLYPKSPSTAVAKGAILRALKKGDGPERITQCSYGFLRDELYEPEKYPEHSRARAKIDEADGEQYVVDTIDWLISAGDRLPNRKEFSIPVIHTFVLNSEKLECVEELYVSENKHQSHYKKGNAKNKGAELAGSIIADMTFLRDENHIQPERRSESSELDEEPELLHWAVRFELVMIVEGRNLRYQARWPEAKNLRAGQRPHIRAQAQVCIAAAFQPGTA
ncbi:unnamed protein product [Periconia digitata]|uniref:Uncharacterized protein n=1 Tax=Periconia digitata TaxID=1303443 RepID=A0A9W4UL97_9PLEO|nr:unnamed protein product [Periconia digitata]